MRQKLRDPQQWNMYGYTRGNPLRYVDPTGKYVCSDGAKCDSEKDKAFEAARQRDLNSKDEKVREAAKAYGDPTVDNKVYVGFSYKPNNAAFGGEQAGVRPAIFAILGFDSAGLQRVCSRSGND